MDEKQKGCEMKSDAYEHMVFCLVKPGDEILQSLTPAKVNVLHMVLGVVGESGELSEAIKKHVAYNKPLDRENVIEELGDIEFYLEGLRQGLGIDRDETLSANYAKLSKRYGGMRFSDAAANDRADKRV
jgi:NTP pyrophosphatase (non-canonical NTP hydrolase)